ncbi:MULTISPECIES: hypothetical protein [unclassified Bradyrhizobium]|uniref:hypothetical protein n=1 Tax=unclassified Bradyrhizobium TaxID=2631580 RepID=UPI0028E85020|nr:MULTISPECIES: hypothetical protein [unclassified Bradyrhizobium]
MKKFIMFICLALPSVSAAAEVGSKDLIVASINDCLKEAVSAGGLEDGGDAIILACKGDKAHVLFNMLGGKIRAEIVQDKNGKFENRPFGNNTCYHRIEDAGGKTSDEFRCDLVLVTGDVFKN